jgi:hypothetical protein
MNRDKIKERLSYGNVVATLALFVALGGASYAATTLPAGSVGTAQLRPGAVTGSRLAFPLGIASQAAMGPITLNTGDCTPQTACPAGVPATLVSTDLSVTKAADILLIGTGSFNLVSPNTLADIDLGLAGSANGIGSVGDDLQEITSTDATTVSVERVVPVHAGRQTFSLTALASGPSESTSVSGGTFQITAIVLPQAPKAGTRTPTSSVPRPVPVKPQG